MASPVVTSPSARPLDPHKQGRYTLRLGDALTQPSGTSSFSSVRFNHKPLQSDSTRTSTINKTGPDRYGLKLVDTEGNNNGTYVYTGKRTTLKRSYVLIFDQEKQDCVLQPLSTSYTFNLQSTPRETSAAKLAQQHPQITARQPVVEKREDDPFGDDASGAGSASEADDNNPYDYRHFFQTGSQSLHSPYPEATIPSTKNTPKQGAGRGTPLQQAHKALSSAVKRAPKATSALRKPPPKKAAPAAQPTPVVRLDRRASTRPTDPKPPKRVTKAVASKASAVKSAEYVHSSDEDDDNDDDAVEFGITQQQPSQHSSDEDAEGEDDDDMGGGGGGLEIDFGGSTPPRMQKQRQILLGSSTGQGPISLRSAASSPRSRIGTPNHHKQSDDVIDFGDADAEGDEDEEYDDMDMVGDGDIEPISLGPPAHERAERMDVDEDDDLEAELMAQLDEDDDDEAGMEDDESDVSEEE